MSWVIPVFILLTILWSYSVRIVHLEKIRSWVLLSQSVFLLLSLGELVGWNATYVWYKVFNISMFLVFCIPYQRICNKQDNDSVRNAMKIAIMFFGIVLGIFVKPPQLLPVIFSVLVFHLYYLKVVGSLREQDRKVKALKEHVTVLRGRAYTWNELEKLRVMEDEKLTS